MTKEKNYPSTFLVIQQCFNHPTTTSRGEKNDIQIHRNIKLMLNTYFKHSNLIFIFLNLRYKIKCNVFN